MAGGDPAPGPRPRNADLPIRAATGLAMIAVTGAALWIGGMAWTVFVLAVGIGVWFEWRALAMLFAPAGMRRTVWSAAGAIYCGIAAAVLMVLREAPQGRLLVLVVLLAVIATDVGAYFTGRTLGGPKIAPAISPSKTWSGLIGGMVLSAGSLLVAALSARGSYTGALVQPGPVVALGIVIVVVAQAGDFFESWMKRRAGVKDSGTLLPGHGGLFDRVDGLMAVLFLIGILLPILALRAL